MIKKQFNNGIQYILLLLDKSAESFCYYNHHYDNCELMPLDILQKCMDFCKKNNLNASILYGKNRLPAIYTKLLGSFPHIKIKPYYPDEIFKEDDIAIIDFKGDYTVFKNIPPNANLNLIIRLKLAEIKSLAVSLEHFDNKFKRLNVIYKDILTASETVLNNFRLDLLYVQEVLFNILSRNSGIEFSLATDRIILTEMNNCNAGITHFTIAPNGKAYICPGFYYSDPENSIGLLENGINIKNQRLLNRDHAPICRVCDCFQCKRCVYMNKISTLEVNTPSHEQCVVSHHERNLSGELLQRFQRRNRYTNFANIPALYYLDPFDLIKRNENLSLYDNINMKNQKI